jgi:hypothetical protein
VRLVHHEQRDLALQQQISKKSRSRNRSGVTYRIFPRRRPTRLLRALCSRAVSDGVDGPGVDAQLVELVRLVLHQRDQRRDHHGQPGQQQRRELVDQRLARAGGHHHQRVAAVQDGADHLLLAWRIVRNSAGGILLARRHVSG